MVTIFDDLITNENDHTSLLRSVMERDPKIASTVLTFLTGSAISEPEAAALTYRSQRTFAQKDGREIPDIFVEGNLIECLIEAKIDPYRELTDGQKNGYAGCFLNDRKGKYLCFLVPITWKHAGEIEAVRRRAQECRINVSVNSWTDLARRIGSLRPDGTQNDLLSEIVRFWNWRFEADRMTEKELQVLRSWSSETYSAVRKLERSVDQLKAICDANGIETVKESDPSWYGFYIKRGKEYLLWVGIWMDGPAPLCFGHEVDKSGWTGPRSVTTEGQLIKKNRVWTFPQEAWDNPERGYEILEPLIN